MKRDALEMWTTIQKIAESNLVSIKVRTETLKENSSKGGNKSENINTKNKTVYKKEEQLI